MPLPPPAVLDTAGRVGGGSMVAVLGGGSGLLWTLDDFDDLDVEPVTSPDDFEENGLSAKRVDSELQLTATTAMTAKTTGRDHGSVRLRSMTRIGLPTRTQTCDSRS